MLVLVFTSSQGWACGPGHGHGHTGGEGQNPLP